MPPRKKNQTVEEVEQSVSHPFEEAAVEPNFGLTVSTGSTLLDLSISGGVRNEGGIPAGIMCEVFGPSGAGKSAVLAEIGASAQGKGGQIRYLDPESRLNKQYTQVYGLNLSDDQEEAEYLQPNTVNEMFDVIQSFNPDDDSVLNAILADSLAALSTEVEMGNDELNMQTMLKRAADFSQGFRKFARKMAQKNIVLVCSNQVRQSPNSGEVVPGGNAIEFYSSLRIRVGPPARDKKVMRERTITINGKEQKMSKQVGIKSNCKIVKSTVDDPFRECPVYVTFGVGIDDVRGNLQWLKDSTGATSYGLEGCSAKGMEQAIQKIEESDKEDELRNRVVEVWHEIERQFRMERKAKKRR